jgi:tetratricopeptide (TPR) repeat protein
MTYGVLTILLGLVIFLVPKLLPQKLKGSTQPQDTDQKSENKKGSGQKKQSSPEKLAQWVLQAEKTKTNLKEKLCRAPVAPHSEALFGRNQVLIDLFKAINKQVSFIELHGKPGVGKTALALEVVNKYKFNYQNILLYLDFGEAGVDELSTKDAMVQVILSIRPTMRIPDNLTQLSKLYQLVMGKHQGVFILDNVVSAERVKELKPSVSLSWLMIVTSEKKLGIDDEALSVNVEPLEIEPAQELLIDRSLRVKPRARETAKLCKGLPLALEICSRFLSTNVKVSPTDFVNLLRKYRNNSLLEQSDEHEEALLAAFKAVYNSLNNKEQKVFNQLAVFPASFDPIAAAQICEENGDCIKTLSQFGLVKLNPVTKRYSLHNWVKNHLKNYLPEKIARETRLRHAAYYLPLLKTAQENILKSGVKARDGLQLFHREWANIRSALDRVRKNSVEGKQAAELFNSYMVVGAELLPLYFFPKECQSYLEAALKVSQRLSTKNSEVQHLVNLGAFYISQARYKEASEYLEQANELATTLQDPQSKGKVLNEIARLYLTTNKPDETVEVLLEKIKLCQENKIGVDDEISLLRLGLAYEKKGEFNKAIEAMKEGQIKAKQAENGHCLETLLKHLGFCLGEIQDFPRAEEYFDACLGLARGLGKKKEEMEILLRFGTIYVKSKDAEQALSSLEEGLQLAEKHNDSRYKGLFLIQIGDAYTLLQDKQKAMQNYMSAMDPLKKAKETGLVNEINKRLSQSFELEENDSTENVQVKIDTIDSATKRVISPQKKLTMGKAINQIQTKTEEFIERGDNKMISYYIGSIEKIIKTYDLDIKDSTTRESLSALMTELRQNNHHACATILKNKFSL